MTTTLTESDQKAIEQFRQYSQALGYDGKLADICCIFFDAKATLSIIVQTHGKLMAEFNSTEASNSLMQFWKLSTFETMLLTWINHSDWFYAANCKCAQSCCVVCTKASNVKQLVDYLAKVKDSALKARFATPAS